MGRDNFYVYAYLDPRKPGNYLYGKRRFTYEPFYIGKGCNNRYKAYHFGNKHLENKLKGTVPIIYIIHSGLSEAEAFLKEIDLIHTIGRYIVKTGPLLNLTEGGEGSSGRVATEETRRKMSIIHKGKVISAESRQKMSEAGKGKKKSEEMKKKLSQARKGKKLKPLSEVARRKISASLKGNKRLLGYKHSEETKLKIAEAGCRRTHSEDTRLKISKALMGNKNGAHYKQSERSLEL